MKLFRNRRFNEFPFISFAFLYTNHQEKLPPTSEFFFGKHIDHRITSVPFSDDRHPRNVNDGGRNRFQARYTHTA